MNINVYDTHVINLYNVIFHSIVNGYLTPHLQTAAGVIIESHKYINSPKLHYNCVIKFEKKTTPINFTLDNTEGKCIRTVITTSIWLKI